MRARYSVVIPLVLAILVAGCADGATTPQSAPTTSAPAPEVSSDTGAVTGTVVDDEAKPLVSADIVMTGPAEVSAKSDNAGRFTFNGLAPGNYVISALKLGFDSSAKKVDIVAGETLDVTLTLEPILVDEGPRQEYQIKDGYIAGPNLYTAGVIYYSTPSYTLNLTRGALDIVASMQWQQNTPTTAKYMRVGITADGETKVDIGVSPLTANRTEMEITKAKEKATVFYSLYFMCSGSTLTPQCFAENPEALLPVIVYEQRVKIYTTVFYNQAAPEGYTGLP